MGNSKFILNPSNGAWGIAEEGKECELLVELGTKIPPKNYLGTHSIILNTTNSCNMGCIYCSAVNNRSDKQMKFNVARRTLDESIKMERVPRIVFHGSEPLMNMQLIEGTVLYGENLVDQGKILFYLQSNLTSLTDEKLKFIQNHNIGVSTSIDGFAEQHNRTRPFRDGSPSYQRVVDNIAKILEFQNGMCVACVVTKYNVSQLSEIAIDLEDKGVTHIQFLPSVMCQDYNGEDFRPTNTELTSAYMKLFEQTFSRMEQGEQKAVIRNIPQFISSLFLRTGVDSCRICSSADYHPILAVDINGDVYPCDYFFGNDKFKIGNIQTDLLHSMLNNPHNPRSNSLEFTACGGCDWAHICGGGCMADRIFSGDKPYYCKTFENIYKYFGSKIPDLKKRGVLKKIIEES